MQFTSALAEPLSRFVLAASPISDNGQDDRVAFGVSAMQGWRISMEDAHAAVLDLQVEDPKKEFQAAESDKRLSFFGVYDDPKYEEEVSGCTASVGLISSTKIFVANAGDSRSVLGVKGRAKPLSFDHKPQNEGEKARICAAGGFVDFGRVNGNLALSRAIGDFEFKKSADLSPEQQIVTAFPDVVAHTISDDDEFLVIACDGIWDCQSSQAVVEFVRRGIAAKQELSKICENMMDNCLASNSETGGVGCDNMTMIVIALLKGKTKDEWYKDIADRVAGGDGPCAPPEYAEFRGPGQRNNFEDSGDDYDMDTDQRTRGVGGRSGRIILLGDGTEVVTDSDDMFDHDEEDKDLDSQVSKGGPQSGKLAQGSENPFDTPPASTPEKVTSTDSRETAKPIPESAIPEKLVSPAKS
ncbi:protein phosphatase 2C [Physcia stellaris]|nr:protein phosphatase 2C [Physcia stellaris]